MKPDEPGTSGEVLIQMLSTIHTKITQSAALNGGFERLSAKIDRMEEIQSKTNDVVDDIHSAIYDPDRGLYARLKDTDNNRTSELQRLDKEVSEIEEVDKKHNSLFEQHEKRLDSIEKSVADSIKLTNRVKWLLTITTGAFITGGVKYVYDIIAHHIVFR